MNKFSAISLAIAALIFYADAHASIKVPVNRATLVRFYHGMNEWCDQKVPKERELDSPNRDTNMRNTTCGICGPIYNGDSTIWHMVYKKGLQKYINMTSVEDDSPIYTGEITGIFNQEDVVEIQLQVRDVHDGGPHRFAIAKSKLGEDPTQADLDAQVLEHENGGVVHDLIDGVANDFKYRLKLPKGFTCERCVLQWQWVGRDAGQVFQSCADVSVV